MESEKKQFRKIYLVNPKFQFTVVAWMLGLSVVTALVFLISNLVFFRHLRSIGIEQGFRPSPHYLSYVADQEAHMMRLFSVTLVIEVLLIVGFGLFASHKIAGPIFRLCQHFNQAQAGKLTKVHFRKGDFFPELEVSLNDYLDRTS